jgi:hypothetical protein
VPLLNAKEDMLREAASNVPPGGWGKAPLNQPAPPAVPTPPKQKSIKRAALPEKLNGEGPGTERVFLPNGIVKTVPGKIGETFAKEHFKTCSPRQGDFVVKSVAIKVQVVGEGEREVRVRKDDANIFEILGGAFAGEEFPAFDETHQDEGQSGVQLRVS